MPTKELTKEQEEVINLMSMESSLDTLIEEYSGPLTNKAYKKMKEGCEEALYILSKKAIELGIEEECKDYFQ